MFQDNLCCHLEITETKIKLYNTLYMFTSFQNEEVDENRSTCLVLSADKDLFLLNISSVNLRRRCGVLLATTTQHFSRFFKISSGKVFELLSLGFCLLGSLCFAVDAFCEACRHSIFFFTPDLS